MPEGSSVDLALVHISSIYGNSERLEKVVPTLRKSIPGLGAVVGCCAAGVVGMRESGRPIEIENRPCFGLCLASLPDVEVQPFYLAGIDVPDPTDPPSRWRRAVGLPSKRVKSTGNEGEEGGGDGPERVGRGGEVDDPIFLVYGTPQSVDPLGDWMEGMDYAFPKATKVGAMSSTVSSLSRSCLFFGEKDKAGTVFEENTCYTDGLAGVCLSGDIRLRSFITQGARPVGPTFHADKVEGQRITSLRVTERLTTEDGKPEDWISPGLPPLAMIKQVQKQQPAVDKSLMQSGLLVGIEPEMIGATPRQLRDITLGVGGCFIVQTIARTNLNDGSITLGNDVEQGQRVQFFVRDRDAAARDFNAALTSYKRRQLSETLAASAGSFENSVSPSSTVEDNIGLVDSNVGPKNAEEEQPPFRAAGTLMFPGFDRGRTLWEEDNYQSSLVLETIPVPLAGFFGNGVTGAISEGSRTALFGTSTAVVVFSPKSGRPTCVTGNTQKTAESGAPDGDGHAEEDQVSEFGGEGDPIIGDDSDDFVVLRRDINSGRAVTSGPVMYSVAESVPQPRNNLEALVWQKEAEVDRFRDRWPLSLLVSRVRMFNEDEANKPRDLLAAMAAKRGEGGMALIAEVKKSTPVKSSIRRGAFNPVSTAMELEAGGAVALAVNTDRKYFGCSYEDLTRIRDAVSVPVMCSDVVVYPYQIYQARLAGADALKLLAPALPQKDLMYFHKIAAAVGMQSIIAVSSVKQMLMALNLPEVKAVSINNRNMATWSLDTGRMNRILANKEVQEGLRRTGATLLVEAGLKTAEDIARVKAAGISCVMVGEALLRSDSPGQTAADLLA
ncbi:unnamed protein product [Discosporangium mesarthrocarpum]